MGKYRVSFVMSMGGIPYVVVYSNFITTSVMLFIWPICIFWVRNGPLLWAVGTELFNDTFYILSLLLCH